MYHDVVNLGTGVTAALTASGASTLATLSDGTKLTFVNIAVSTLTNNGTSIT